MYILDTDHLSFIQRNGQEGKQILARLAVIEELEVAVTVITYEEQVRGRLNFLSKARTLDEQILAYTNFKKECNSVLVPPLYKGGLGGVEECCTILEKWYYQGLQQLALDYQSIVIIPFNRAAALEHQRLRKMYPRLGNMDLKIAAITLINNATLLTRNKSDFGQVLELRIEDWSAPYNQ
ncbi:type II toxin-antitoxin system VapC family toxin [Tychonema sp. LEGE 07199]|uniref:type II toxin-antitoxin system VapC family toxin n=1 Tax=unclassified Tychonema TaxID=2642144 RepID=UPI00188096B5|nr:MULTISPECIES: type II toxin-antitoxin system VapC family toxin [unclassified Tychonema]MBE9119575.1 type II toxin-antitoxin system VapC family toxin [Tychonema sp. LEGE 07199]MBE9131779.1 type II toxin-antitoxin system VapC family toxin [Tychonema sp. LEGE 07196]